MSEEKKETAIVRKIWKQNKTTMEMEELWIFQPDLSKDYSDFDHMQWILREMMCMADGLADGDSWKLIPKCIYEISEEKYHGDRDGGISWREPGVSNMAEKK